MRRKLAATLALVLLASPVLADKKLDDAIAKAEEQLQKGKPEEGLKGLQKVVTGSPSSEGYLALARFQEKLGSLDDAAASAAKAVDLAGGGAAKAEALAYQSSLTLLVGTGKDALALAQQAVAAEATPAALAAQARAQVRGQDPVAALQSADKAVAAGANSALALEARGDALLALKRSDEAVAAYRKALEMDPKLNRARIGLAAALTAAGKGAEAQAEAKKASEADQKSAEAFATLGLALLAQAVGPDGTVTNQTKWSEAIAEAQQGAFVNPKSVVAQMAVGRMFEAAGNTDQAKSAYDRAHQLDPAIVAEAPGLIRMEAAALWAAYPPAKLQQKYREAREKAPEWSLEIARATLAKDEGFTKIKKFADDRPKSGEAQLWYARYLMALEEYRVTLEVLEKAVRLAPNSAEAHADLGTVQSKLGRPDEALKSFEKAVQLDPKQVPYRTSYAALLGQNGEHQKGVAELLKVVNAPGYKDTNGFTNLGYLYRTMNPKKAQEAVAAYQKALELDPKNAQAAFGMGLAQLDGATYDAAIGTFQRVMQIEPNLTADAYNLIAWCHFFKGELTEAKASLQKAQAAGRSDARLTERIQRVEKLAADAARDELRRQAEERLRQSDPGTLARRARSGDIASRIRAVRDLGNLGAQAVASLIGVLVADDSATPVREAAVIELAQMGPTAREAVPYMDEILRTDCGKTIMTRQEMEESVKCEDLKRKTRDARLKIQK
jgi:tetratricopeptide (TPR) repeat protein